MRLQVRLPVFEGVVSVGRGGKPFELPGVVCRRIGSKAQRTISPIERTFSLILLIVNRLKIALGILAVFLTTACVAQQEQPVEDTVDYLKSVLETGGDDQKILFGGDYRKEACRLFISDTITYHLSKPSRVYPTEVQFHLGTLDPKSLKVIEKRSTLVTVEFETTDYKRLIWTSASGWKEANGRVPKELELFSSPTYLFRFLNSASARHFAKAFEHAIELCGGKQSRF